MILYKWFHGCMSGTGLRAGTGFPVFECTSGENVLLEQLCDGVAHCGAGDDETTPLCESKSCNNNYLFLTN